MVFSDVSCITLSMSNVQQQILPDCEQQYTKIAHALANRVDRILLVLECCTDNKNYLACLRTCDILGVQRVWIIEAPLPAYNANKHRLKQVRHGQQVSPVHPAANAKRAAVEQGRTKARIARASTQWLDVQQFSSSEECMQQLKADGWQIWATDLSPGALALSQPNLQLPPKLAVVMGSEAKGVSAAVRAAADRCVYLPMYGFTESLNVSVATALVLQTLITASPSVRGDLIGGEQRAAELEAKWTAVTQGRQQQGTAAADALDAECLEVQQSHEE